MAKFEKKDLNARIFSRLAQEMAHKNAEKKAAALLRLTEFWLINYAFDSSRAAEFEQISQRLLPKSKLDHIKRFCLALDYSLHYFALFFVMIMAKVLLVHSLTPMNKKGNAKPENKNHLNLFKFKYLKFIYRVESY